MIDQVPLEVLRLKSLRVLVLSGNKLTSLPAQLGQSLPELQELVLSRNKLTTEGVNAGRLPCNGMRQIAQPF